MSQYDVICRQISRFIDAYLEPRTVSVDSRTRRPFDLVALDIWISEGGIVQYFPKRMFLVKDYQDEAVGCIIRIVPFNVFGYYNVKKPMPLIDIIDKLDKEFGVKMELARLPPFT